MNFNLRSRWLTSLSFLIFALAVALPSMPLRVDSATADTPLTSDKAFLAHDGDCSVATKKLSNQLVRTLSEIHDAPNLPTAVSLIKALLAPHQRQPGGSPAMTSYKESVLGREVRDAANPYTILELRSQLMFFNSTGAWCFQKADNTNAGMGELNDTSYVHENFSTYILKLPRNIYAKITFAGNKTKNWNYASKGVPIMDNTLDRYTIAYGRPENALMDYTITDPITCTASAGDEYSDRAVLAQKFVGDAVKIIREVSVASAAVDNSIRTLVKDYELACGKQLYNASNHPSLVKPAAEYQRNIEALKKWIK